MLQYLDAIIAGVAGTLIISYCLYLAKRAALPPLDGHRKKPPMAAGQWPLIGHLHLLGGSGQLPYEKLGDLADLYGPIFSIRIGVHTAVVVSSWELAKECFTTLDAIVSSRPKFTAAKILTYDYVNFAFAPYGEFWREIRKIIASELLSARRFDMLRGIRDSEVEASVKEMYRKCVDKSDVVEMKRWLGDLNLNAVLRMVVGKRYTARSEDEWREVGRIRRVFREFFRLTGVHVIGDAIPFLGWLDFGGQVKEMKKTAKEMDEIICEWLKDHRRRRECGDDDQSDAQTEQDFIDVLLSVLHNGADLDGYDLDTVIKATSLMIISGATDTTAVTMIWTLSLLINHQHALKKVRDELDEQVGKERLVKESDINKLTYLQAVVKESMRLYPAGPLSGPREFTEDCTLGGYHIKAGTRMFLNIWKLHRDPRVWLDPLEFKPERFLTTHKDLDVKGQHFELLPFGGGRRSCPGITFGVQMTHLALAAFLHAFEVTTPFDAPVDMSASFGLTMMKATPFELLLKPRLSPSIYH
ncbi:cytochrome P450 CYP82D47 [Arachis hypogaea]|uniref:Cytochrome P450 n=1 Tax=Arachis hypogaea TaxID=3818 RepID=A0A445C7D5_ARAHY|nr:cytochrome P450 CYP82D47 [Arachis hypogaea]QHO27792.1 Cytochrome P450 [Arachis hypogaea]RYR46783.1 hypothetical protein Ahy_A07g032599 [Arachis hypogaea]